MNWIKRLRAKWYKASFDRGYAWAHSECCSNKLSQEDISNLIDSGLTFSGDNPFDRGAQAAQKDFTSASKQVSKANLSFVSLS
jgi:hypothetical protein